MDLRDWVWKSTCPLSLSQAAVWAALAALRRRNNPGQLVYPSLEEIARAAKVSKSTVIRTLKDLERLELIEIYRKTKKGSARDEVNRYRVKVPEAQPSDLAEKVAALKKSDQVSKRPAVKDAGGGRSIVTTATDQVSQRPRLGVTDPLTRCQSDPVSPAKESLPKESITPNSHSRIAASENPPFGIDSSDGSAAEVGDGPSADDAAAPRADDGDEDASVPEVGARPSVDSIRDVGEPTEKQIRFLRDLYIHAYGEAPDWRFFQSVRRLDHAGVTRSARALYREIEGRCGNYAIDDEAYDLLSALGKEWADCGLDPSEALFVGTENPCVTEEES